MKNKIAYIVVFLLFFVTPDTLTIANANKVTFGLVQGAYVLTGGYILYKYSYTRLKELMILYILLGLILSTSILNFDFSAGYLIQGIVLIFGYIVCTRIKFAELAYIYNKFLYLICIISIVLFFAFILFPFLTVFFPVQVNSEEVEYINLYFYSHYLYTFRNTGVFREPGVYMIFINIGLLIELMFKDKPRKKYLIVYIAALLTTLSTAGYVVCSAIACMYMVKNRNMKSLFYFGSMVILVLLVIVSNYELFELTLNKFDSSSDNHDSAIARLASVSVPWAIFSESPFFGVGLRDYGDWYVHYSRLLYGYPMKADGHSTNTLFNVLATYGAFIFIGIIVGLYKATLLFSEKTIFRLGIMVIFVLMLSNEDLRYSIILSVLLFYGFTPKNQLRSNTDVQLS